MTDIHESLTSILSEKRVHTRLIDRVAFANDASYFRLVPQAVVQPASIDEIRALFTFSQQKGIPMTFRSAGTSLSGQAVTDGILVDISRYWGRYTVEKDGAFIRSQPGIIGGFLNKVLNPLQRRIGPDPASIDACMLGGILANNSSGMCCGVTENSYRTIHSMTIVLPNGFTLDTAAPDATDQLQQGVPDIVKGILELKRRLLSAPEDPNHLGETLAQRVRRRYKTKNNNGYLLNAFLDFDSPLDILTHLMIGSQGTLGFIAEAVLHTLPDFSFKYTGQLYFKNIQDAANAIAPLRDSGVRAAEIMDRASLRAVESMPGVPEILRGLPDGAAAILAEYQAVNNNDMSEFKKKAASLAKELRLLHDAEFTDDPGQQAALWKPRKGIIASVGALRAPGTTCVNEDVAFPFQHLAAAVTDLRAIFDNHGFSDGVVFGHAKDGNLHFLINQAFDTPEKVHHFDAFLRNIVATVSGKYDGALKAEHGTGRNMSPFVETEWGSEAYTIMRDLKSLFDPDNMLSPGVLINSNPQAHITFLKNSVPVAPEVDQCIECGYCESKCPSAQLTLTPRQRIVVQREISRLRLADAGSSDLASLVADFTYAGLDTCAVDGLCATACPVGINTGDLVKRLRAEMVRSENVALWISANLSVVEKSLGWGVRVGHAAEKVLAAGRIKSISIAAEKLTGVILPKWNSSIPSPTKKLGKLTNQDNPSNYVYFPSCISRQLGQPKTDGKSKPASLAETLIAVAQRAQITLSIPADVEGRCCGMPFGSKGYKDAYKATVYSTLRHMWEWSEHGKLPIVIDTTSCLLTLRTCGDVLEGDVRKIWQGLIILDSVEFIYDILLPNLVLHPVERDVVLHPNCSARKLGLDGKMQAIAKKCARSVTVPINLGCCAFAGDRGLLYPELTESATKREAGEVTSREYGGYYSSNITCEMGMSEAIGKNYSGIIYLVDSASK